MLLVENKEAFEGFLRKRKEKAIKCTAFHCLKEQKLNTLILNLFIYAPFCLFFAEIYFNLTKKKQPESRKNYLFHDYSQCRFEDSNLFLFSGS